MKYFAYGSNMDIHQMSIRCPHSHDLGLGILHGHRFRIDGRGVATVDPDSTGTVHGVVWDLPPVDEETLDRYEGVPRIYQKRIVQMEHGGTMMPMQIYIGRDGMKGRSRPRYPVMVVEEGAPPGFRQIEVYEWPDDAWRS